LLPQLSISGSASMIDRDRADEILGLNPERRAAVGAEFEQLIYSDDVKAEYAIERELQDLRSEERAELRLDVIFEAAANYIDVLRAKTVERIQTDNLRLTRSNLELAQSRVEIGEAGREELFRWESQIATNRKSVVEASAIRSQAEIAVNRVLNRPIEETFFTTEVGLNDPELVSGFEQIRPYIESPGAFQVFRAFMVRDAFENSPELKQLDAAVRAQERELKASNRAFYVPTVGIGANVEQFARGGAGSQPLPEFPNLFADRTNWNLFASAKLPLFQGYSMRARRGRAELELDSTRLQQEATRQRVEQRVRSLLHQTGASFVGIDLTRDGSEAAGLNLELVRERYAAGVVDILRLLDAQTQSLVADLAVANALFDYLIDLMGTQRAVGRFDYYRSPADRQLFLDELREFFAVSGYTVRSP
jgi:outer membrane protein TolC